MNKAKLETWLEKEWGATLQKCGGPRAIGRSVGSWKTGWQVGVALPGFKYSWYHFRTLKAVAERFGYEEV